MGSVDIAIISPDLLEAGTKRGGGIEEIDIQIAHQLSKFFKVMLISTFYQKYNKFIYLSNNLSIEQIKFPSPNDYPPKFKFDHIKNFLFTFIYIFFIFEKIIYLKQNQVQLIIVHNGLPGLTSAIVANLLRIKIVYSEGNLTPWVKTNIFTNNPNKLEYSLKLFGYIFNLLTGILISKFSDHIRVQSDLIKDGFILKNIPNNKITVISGGVDIDLFKPTIYSHRCDLALKIGFIGRLTEEKGSALLVNVVKSTLIEIPNIHFIILGEGPYKEYLTKSTNVEYIGWVPRNELNIWLLKIQIILFFQKDLGLAELESMAAGKAIIACNLGVVLNTIKHLHNGMLCEPTVTSYLNAIKILLNDGILLKKISNNARETAVNQFSWKVIGEKWINLCISQINPGVS